MKQYGGTVIKLETHKSTIGRKVLVSQLSVLVLTLLMIAIAFSFITRYYAIQQTTEGLQDEGRKILALMSEIQQEADISEREQKLSVLKMLNQFRVAGRLISAQIVIVDPADDIRFSTVDNMTSERLESMIEASSGRKRAFVHAKITFSTENQSPAGVLYLFAKIEDISALNEMGLRLLLVSFIIGIFFSMLLSGYLQKRMSKPIKMLRNEMQAFSMAEFESSNVKSNDEIGELARSFEELAYKLQSYDEHQKNFFQNASHELKTPLMSIQGYAEAIKDGIVEGEEMDQGLEIIIDESQRLKRLVDEIIYLTKLETVDDMFVYEEVDLGMLIQSAIMSVNALAMEKKIEINYQPVKSMRGNYDSAKMKQALINILGNGVRYAQHQIRVCVETEHTKLQIRIIDDGRGFVLGEEKLLFERFYKGHKGGTGIGLSITKAIVEKHGGVIKAVNHPEMGAEFIIELPR